ncbi:MAG: mechanosensitive ion channel family protein [Lachnospiraceae bacterium]|nr:mechanosensitive ion channel family protein [Lachnospiraceae bacterium]
MKQEFYRPILDELANNGITGPKAGIITFVIVAIVMILAVGIYILLYMLLKKVTHKIFRILEKKQGRRIHLEFLERMVRVGIVLVTLISILGWENIGRSLLGSAAVLTGIIGFAAQDVIKDILSGLLISIYKPFDLGDRIELDDGRAGIVESITMRHVVIIGLDTLRMVIPNSKINAAMISNYSFGYVKRSCIFRFPVGYDSDIEKTKDVIAGTIRDNPYTIPGKKQKDGSMDYAPVYFIEIADSALIMTVTVYYEPKTSTEFLKDQINTAVFDALDKNGIEIPYNYSSVIIKDQGETEK